MPLCRIHAPEFVVRRTALLVALAIVAAIAPSVASAAPDRTAPSEPTNLRVESTTASSIALTWSAATDNARLKGYGIYLNSSGISFTNKPFVSLEGLVCGQTYSVGVDAFDTARNRSPITTVLAATSPCTDTEAPTAPQRVWQVTSSGNEASLGWEAASDDVGVAGYEAYVGGLLVATTQQTAASFSGLQCGSSYAIAVVAYDAAGNRSPRAEFVATTSRCGDTQAPTQPTSVSQTGATATSVSVSWHPSTDAVGVVAYDVSIDGTRIGIAPSPSYTATGLACGNAYQMTIVARDDAGNGSAPAVSIASTSPCITRDTTPPSTPSGLAASRVTASDSQLSWSASSDNVGVAGYDVYVDGIRSGGTTAAPYTVDTLNCGVSYDLGVDAYDASGNRSTRARITIATPTCGSPTPSLTVTQISRTETSIAIAWSLPVDVPATSYELYRNGVRVAQVATTAYTFIGLACGTSYTLGIALNDGIHEESLVTNVLMTTSACSDNSPPAAPAGLSPSGVTQTSAAVTWNDVAGASGYGLYVNGQSIGTTAQTTYTFSGLACGTTYTFGLEAFDSAGNRSARTLLAVSTSACTTPPPTTAAVWLSPSGDDATCLRGDSRRPCRTFGRAYQTAQAGDTVAVAGGSYPPSDQARGAITIFATEAKRVSFKCADPANAVTTTAEWFTIKAKGVRIVGGCFRVHALRFGEPGDQGLTSQDNVVDGIKMQGYEIVGADSITIRNSEVGPAVKCYAQGTTGTGISGGPIDPSMWCDPNGPEYESFYAYRGSGKTSGSSTLPFQPFIHNNAGARNPSNIVIEGNYVHDLQTKDAFNLHTGCGLTWMQRGSPSDNLVIRGNRFENCAVLGLLFDNADGVTIENNMFGYPTEPLSNGRGAVETNIAQREVVLKTGGTGAGWNPSNWLVRFNSFAHGMSIDNSGTNPSYTNFRVIGNILGRYSYCKGRGEVFDSNVFASGACGSNGMQVGSLPYVRYSAPIDYHLTGGNAVDLVTRSTADFGLGIDIDGESRPAGARDAGSDETQ